ncbi:hypothetical protein [Nonomuraea polychroma]|uniref:hypothetical protein n=1 Tax=Nonomuraea polychroma TaxID=46176 RepID=UPI000FDF0B0A|nr:hypothetical protein [Nonomuraea polychroma]
MRRRPRAIVARAAVVAVPTLVAQLLLARATERPLVWLGYPFAAADIADSLRATTMLVVNSVAIVVLSGLLAPHVTGSRPVAGRLGGLTRLCGLTFLLSGTALGLCAAIPSFQDVDAPLSAWLGPGLPFYLASLIAISAVEIRFSFAAPGVTLKGLRGRDALRMSRRLTRGLFVKVVTVRCLARALLEGFGGILGTAAVVLLAGTAQVASHDPGPTGWAVVVAVKWLVLTCVLSMTSMLALLQYLRQDARLHDEGGNP